jgi:hypothetical protein
VRREEIVTMKPSRSFCATEVPVRPLPLSRSTVLMLQKLQHFLITAAIIFDNIASGSPPLIARRMANIAAELSSLSDDDLDDSSNEREDDDGEWDCEAMYDSLGAARVSRRRNSLHWTLRANVVQCLRSDVSGMIKGRDIHLP